MTLRSASEGLIRTKIMAQFGVYFHNHILLHSLLVTWLGTEGLWMKFTKKGMASFLDIPARKV